MYFGIFCTKKCGAKQNVVAWRKTEATTQFRNSSGRDVEPMFCPVSLGVTQVTRWTELEARPHSLHASGSKPSGVVSGL